VDPEAALAAVTRMTGLAPWSARLMWVGRRIAQGMTAETQAEERLTEAETECTTLERTISEMETQYRLLKSEARLSSHVVEAVPARGLRSLAALPHVGGPWPVKILQGKDTSAVWLTLGRELT
jgi:hypothetical protein